MRDATSWRAALAALFFLGGAVAQPTPLAARLANAKLAESRGDVAVAEQELKRALAEANAGERQQVAAALGSFLERLGRLDEATAVRGAPAPKPQGGEDPVQRLIAVLDTGTTTKEGEVSVANQELRALGSLAVPQLLAALPRLGPFGFRNVLGLLAQHDDPRITTALVALADKAEPGVAANLATWLGGMKPGVALPLARRLARTEGSPNVQARALAVLLRSEPDVAEHADFARRLAEDATGAAQPVLLEAIGDANAAWVADVLTVLREHGPAASRVEATRMWIGRLPEDAEDRGLAAIAAAPAEARFELAHGAASAHASWVRTGVQVLQLAVDRPAHEQVVGQGGLAMRWELRPDDCAAALLGLPRRDPFCDHVALAIVRLAQRGWRLPPARDADWLAVVRAASENYADALLAALPADAEDRALALTKDLSNQEVWAIATQAHRQGRPWHRLIAGALARAGDTFSGSSLLERSWVGAGPDVIAQLVALSAACAGREPRQLCNQSVTSVAQNFVNAYRLSLNLPAALLLPWLATDSGGNALAELSEREPQAALAHLRAQQQVPRSLHVLLANLLHRSGTADDLPTAVRLARQSDMFQRPEGHGLAMYLRQHGRGSLEVLQLGAAMPRTSSQYKNEVVAAALSGIGPADFAPALALAPTLDRDFGNGLLGRLERMAAPEHGAALLSAVERCLQSPWAEEVDASRAGTVTNQELLQSSLRMLGATGHQAAHALLRGLLAKPEFADLARASHLSGILATTATAAVQTAGPARPQFVRELLGSARVEEVAAALASREAWQDQELRDLARAAVLRHAGDLQEVAPWFAKLDAAQRTALAAAVLDDEAFARCAKYLAIEAVQALGALKQSRWIPQLARAAAHSDDDVRRTAAEELGRTFAREAAPHLLELLKDDDESVRKQAKQGLDQIASYLEERAKWEQRLK